MKKEIFKTVDLSKNELLKIEGGSLSEVASKIWKAIGFSLTLNYREMTTYDSYQQNFYNH